MLRVTAIIAGMADEETVGTEVEVVDVVDAARVDVEVVARIDVSSAQFMQWALQAICGLNMSAAANLGGQTMRLYTSDPGTSGANFDATVGAVAVSWNGGVSGGGNVIAQISSSPCTFNITAGGTVREFKWYGIFNGNGVFLYGKPLSSPITISAGQTATISVTAVMSYDIN